MIIKKWNARYTEGDDAAKLAAEKAAQEAAAQAQAKAEKAKADAAAAEAKAQAARTFNQEAVDKIVQDRLRKSNEEKAELLTKIAAAATTEQEKADALKQLQETREAMMTKEQAAQAEIQRVKAEGEAKFKAKEAEAQKYKETYEGERVAREVMEAAVKGGGSKLGAPQIADLLASKAKVVEEVVDGKPTGKFVVRVKAPTSKGIVEDTPEKVVAAMKADVDRWGNMFESPMVGGLGATGPQTPGPPQDLENLTMEEISKRYRTDRKSLGLKPR